MCHGLARAGIGVLLVAACAGPPAWTRVDAVCTDASPPRLCFEAEPDAPLELRFAGESLLPRECAEASARSRGLWLRVRLFDGRGAGSRTSSRDVHLTPGRTTIVTASSGRALAVDHARCDARPLHP